MEIVDNFQPKLQAEEQMAESYEPQPVMIDESLEMLQEQMNAVEYEADGYGRGAK